MILQRNLLRFLDHFQKPMIVGNVLLDWKHGFELQQRVESSIENITK